MAPFVALSPGDCHVWTRHLSSISLAQLWAGPMAEEGEQHPGAGSLFPARGLVVIYFVLVLFRRGGSRPVP